MLSQQKTNEHRKKWLKAERDAIIIQFQMDTPWIWALKQSVKPVSEGTTITPKPISVDKDSLPANFTKADFIDMLKKVARSLDEEKSET